MSRHPKGSTPALTLELIERIAETIRRGSYVETACALCGISKDTFYRWLRQAQGKEATDLTKRLSDAVEKAQAEAELRDLAVIDGAAQAGEWTAAAWRLERRSPQKWGRQARVQVEHSGSIGPATSEVDLARLSKEELLLLEKALDRNDETETENAPH